MPWCSPADDGFDIRMVTVPGRATVTLVIVKGRRPFGEAMTFTTSARVRELAGIAIPLAIPLAIPPPPRRPPAASAPATTAVATAAVTTTATIPAIVIRLDIDVPPV